MFLDDLRHRPVVMLLLCQIHAFIQVIKTQRKTHKTTASDTFLQQLTIYTNNMPELTPADIVAALQSRGWKASIVSSAEVATEMVPTKGTGILKCVDGRGEIVTFYYFSHRLEFWLTSH
jgi:uncharacterized membrane protein